ncbi:hypothetical protein Golomagni_04581 [Golovinomyces magnicellulatus]|nr:hypothetical protein Golomagni_04581 [Golovinomyces magnicellulatus]
MIASQKIDSYIEEKLNSYVTYNKLNSKLWEQFQHYFKDFTIDSLKSATLRSIQNLRDCLLSRRVYVTKNEKRKTIAQALFECITEDGQHQWTDDEIIKAIDRIDGSFISSKLNNRLNIIIATKNSSFSTPGSKSNIEDDNSNPISQPYGKVSDIDSEIKTNKLRKNSTQSEFKPSRSVGFGKEIANLAKVYTDEQKYSDSSDSIDFKLRTFFDICNRTDIPEEVYSKTFTTILKGLALDLYYLNDLSKMIFLNAVEHLCNYFQGPEIQRKNLNERNNLILKSVISSNPEKSVFQCLQQLVHSLRELWHRLEVSLQTPDYLHDKIIVACQGVPACGYAVSDPPYSLGALINKLKSSISAYEKENESSETFFTDKRFHLKEKSKTKFKEMFKGRLGSRSFNNNEYQERLWQYILDCKGNENEWDSINEDEFNGTFNSLTIELDHENPSINNNKSVLLYLFLRNKRRKCNDSCG